ncbi:hypothetical protein [Bifidobacterium apri]|uniref:Uncharacterized protein n=1 Tax=Bifidobacterium apri TaxID=1769423 RepID=A0A6A2W087_9BIFI|nr:hypothetical protein [Bifidobacterium apri]KAB8292707.1 hypothetical protein DSM100238_1792 [Bifidobacterium apri]
MKQLTLSEMRMINAMFEKHEEEKHHTYLDMPNFTIYYPNRDWGDGDLTYTDADGVEWVFDNEDIQGGLYTMWCEDYPDDTEPPEDVWESYVRDNIEDECLDCIAGGYFRDGSHSWHDAM